jgi:O-antigen ligase
VVAIMIYFVLPERAVMRINSMVDPAERAEDQSIQSRFDMLTWTGRAFMQSPIVGVGLVRYVPWIQSQPGGAMYKNSIHSGFLGILVHQGLLGLLPFLALLFTTWTDYSAAQRMARARRARGDPALAEIGAYALFLQIALLGCIVGALTHPMATSKGWWIVMGLSAVVAGLARARSAQLESEQAQAVEPEPALGFGYGRGVAPASR